MVLAVGPQRLAPPSTTIDATRHPAVFPPDSALLTEIADTLRAIAQLPGLSIAALADQRVVYARGFGFRDIAAARLVDSSTQFNAASVSKVITATAALHLHQAGRMRLDDPVQRFIPGFPDSTDGITPRRLAAHLSGLPHYGPGYAAPDTRFTDVVTALDVFARQPRVGPPGGQYFYSTHGFTLLSACVQVAAGRPFLDVLRTDVFEPLDMPNSGPMRREAPTPTTTRAYERVQGRLSLLASHREYSYSWAGAGLRTTPADLVRMSRAYFHGYLADSVVRVAFTEQRTLAGAPTGVGFAWRVGTDFAGRRIVHHAGSNDGARSMLLLYPDERRALAFQTNVQWVVSVEPTAAVMAEAFFRSDRTAPTLRVNGRWSGSFDGAAASGEWEMHGAHGWITTPSGFAALLARDGVSVPRLPVRAIREGVYALITPWGLYPLRVDGSGTRVTATVDIGTRAWRMRAE